MGAKGRGLEAANSKVMEALHKRLALTALASCLLVSVATAAAPKPLGPATVKRFLRSYGYAHALHEDAVTLRDRSTRALAAIKTS